MAGKRAERGQPPPAEEVATSRPEDAAAPSAQAARAWDYAPAPESREIVSIAAEYGLFIDGEFGPAADRRQFPTINPATEEPLARVALAGQADVDRAVAAARRAYQQVWGPMPGAERAKYLYRIARILQERAREFAVLESLDNGKPIRESRDVDVPLAAAHFFYYAGWADKLEYAGLGMGSGAGVAARADGVRVAGGADGVDVVPGSRRADGAGGCAPAAGPGRSGWPAR